MAFCSSDASRRPTTKLHMLPQGVTTVSFPARLINLSLLPHARIAPQNRASEASQHSCHCL